MRAAAQSSGDFAAPDVAVPTDPLVQPSLRWLIELHMEGSFPLHLTGDELTTARMGAGPELVSTLDVAPPMLGGIGWGAEVQALTPVIWFPFDEEANVAMISNRGSAGGIAMLLAGAQEIDVTTPIRESATPAKFFATPDGRMHREMALVLPLQEDHTWIFWLRTGLPPADRRIIDYVATGGMSAYVELAANGNLNVGYGFGKLFGPFVADGEWHMVVIDVETDEGATTVKTMRLYLDGVPTNSMYLSGITIASSAALRFGVHPVAMDEVIWLGGTVIRPPGAGEEGAGEDIWG